MPNPSAADEIFGFNDLSFGDVDKFDPVHKPKHYNRYNMVECIEGIEACTGASFSGYLQGNAMKYLWRYRYKDNAVQDLEKSQWYLSKLIETVKKEGK